MSVPKQRPNPFRRLYKATGYSIEGLTATYRTEPAFRLETYILCVLAPIAIWIAQTPLELALLVGSWLLVMVVELINSAIEAVVDRISSETHELSGRAKDASSAAVMVSVLLFLVILIAVLLNRS